MTSYTFEFNPVNIINDNSIIKNNKYMCEMKLDGLSNPKICLISTNFDLQSGPRTVTSYYIGRTREQVENNIIPVYIPKWNNFHLTIIKITIYVPDECEGFPNVTFRGCYCE